MAKNKKTVKKAQPIAKKTSNNIESKTVFSLIKESFGFLKTNWQIFLKILVIYSIIYVILVLGFSSPGNLTSTSSKGLNNEVSKISSSFNSFGLLLNSSTSANSNPSASVYQLILFIILSLVLLWTIKELQSNAKIKAKDSFYKSMSPFIPFFLVLIVMAIELVPISIAFALYNYAIVGGVAVGLMEHTIWAIIIALLIIISLYFITSSSLALLITSLEGLTPMNALRRAKRLVKNRRLLVALKIAFLFVFILFVMAILMSLVILTVPSLAAWILQILLLIGIVFAYIYLYFLYKDLSNGFKES